LLPRTSSWSDDELLDASLLELEAASLELEDSSLELEDSSLELEDSSLELEDSSLELEDSSLELEDSSLELEDSQFGLFPLLLSQPWVLPCPPAPSRPWAGAHAENRTDRMTVSAISMKSFCPGLELGCFMILLFDLSYGLHDERMDVRWQSRKYAGLPPPLMDRSSNRASRVPWLATTPTTCR
jgi:hypothetical protein